MIVREFGRNTILNRIEKLLGARYDRYGYLGMIKRKLESFPEIRKVRFVFGGDTASIIFISEGNASLIDVEERNAAWWLERWLFFEEEESNE